MVRGTLAETTACAIGIPFPERGLELDAVWSRGPLARALLVLAHGAGAGMRHPFVEAAARELNVRGVDVLRYQFPYMQEGRRRPDPQGTLVAAVQAVIGHASAESSLPLFAGGKSMGGRMTAIAASRGLLSEVTGLVFLGFPLHRQGAVSVARAGHLEDIRQPMLFVQGTRDRLADLTSIRSVCDGLGDRATLHIEEGGDHSFHILRRSGRTPDEVMASISDRIASWIAELS